MTSQDVDLQMFLGGVWTDVPLYSATGVTVTRGMDSDGTWPRPTKVECEINNDTLDYDPSRPESSLYGVAGRNTRIRIRPDGTTRTWAEASSWAPDRTGEHEPGTGRGRSWTKLTAEGLLRRLGMWTDPLRSPMYRTISGRSTSIGHWSLEDDRDALRLANSSGGTPGTYRGIELAEEESPLGAERSVKIADGSQMSGRFDNASTTAGWQFAFSMRLGSLPPSATYVNLMYWTCSNGYTWYWDVNDASYRLNVRDADSTLVFTNNVSFGAGAEPTEWVTFRCKADQVSGDVVLQQSWYAQGMTVSYAISDSFAGTVGALRTWTQGGNATTAEAHFSHIFGVTTTADSLTGTTAQKVFNGYLGEFASDRFARLTFELGITRYQDGDDADTQTMGPQKADTFLNLMKEVVETDDCLIYDEPFDIALTLRTRGDMYDQTPALVLTFPDDFVERPQRLLDDAFTHNQVTVKNRSGGEVTRTLTTGPMSTQAPPDGVGEYKHTVDVNVEDDGNQLANLADWHLAKGTLDRPRYSEVTVDLLANPSLVTDVVAMELGDVIQIDDLEPDPVYLMVTGFVEKIGAVTRTVTFAVAPYEPYQTGEYDRADTRYDARTSTVSTTETTTSTAWQVECTDPEDVWSTTGTPYDWMVAGERVTVTAMNAATGSGPYVQTCTVTRSVNGVVKAQAVGNTVHIADPKRWAL